MRELILQGKTLPPPAALFEDWKRSKKKAKKKTAHDSLCLFPFERVCGHKREGKRENQLASRSLMGYQCPTKMQKKFQIYFDLKRLKVWRECIVYFAGQWRPKKLQSFNFLFPPEIYFIIFKYIIISIICVHLLFLYRVY